MAWDDAAPTPTDLAPASGGWDSAPPSPDELKPGPSLSGFGHNAWEDLKGNVEGLGNLAKTALTQNPVKTFIDVATGIPATIGQELERTGVNKLLPSHNFDPIGAGKQFAKAVYEKPVSTFLDVAPLAGAAKGISKLGEVGKIAEEAAKAGEIGTEAAPVAEDAARVAAEAPKPVELPAEAAQELAKVKPPEAAPVAEPAPVSTAGKITNAASNASTLLPPQITEPAKEVKDYISRGYEGFAKKPGSIANVADYVQGKSQMMAAQQMGATPLQARQVGHEGMRAIGQYGLDHDIVSGTTGLKGMREKNTALLNDAGKQIDTYRSLADKAGVPYKPNELLQQVKARLDQKYLRGVTPDSPAPRGVYGKESGSYRKALQEVADAAQTHSGAAKTATLLNKAANDANRLKQPHGAFTDVANALSDINNERIHKMIGPDNAAKYDQALREFGVNKKISAMLDRKEAGEVKRFGPGSVTSNLTQKAMDEFGYRMGAKVANKVSTSILKNPSIAKDLPSLFKEFINQVEETGNEVTGLAYGGQVTPEMAEFVGSR